MNQAPHSSGMSVIVRTVTRWLKGFIFLYGLYIVLYGHLSPGGGFAGGVIIANAFVLLILAEGRRAGPDHAAAEGADSVGGLLFLGLACLGLALGVEFFTNIWPTTPKAHYHLLSGGLIPLANIAIGMKVAGSLLLVFAVLAALRPHAAEESPEGAPP